MLTAEENIVLPLSIAGEKPDPEFFERPARRRSASPTGCTHRPSELSGGQQQRVAIARALVSRPTVVFADEPTGNLDSTTGGEILELLRDSVDAYGQTTVMVTHEPRAAAIADRILFLADGLIVQDLPGATPARDHRGRWRRSPRDDDRRFALKGLLGRKLRTALTALAIVLGVAMISGTLRPHRLDRHGLRHDLHRRRGKGSDAVVTGKSAFDLSDGSGATAPAFPTSRCCRRCAASPASSAAEGSVDGEAQLIGKDGKAIVYGGAPNLGFAIAQRRLAVQPARRSSRATGPGRTRS